MSLNNDNKNNFHIKAKIGNSSANSNQYTKISNNYELSNTKNKYDTKNT